MAVSPRFQAVLDATNGDANFSIVETNKFKHLTHISLIFRIGTDTTVKQVAAAAREEGKGKGRMGGGRKFRRGSQLKRGVQKEPTTRRNERESPMI